MVAMDSLVFSSCVLFPAKIWSNWKISQKCSRFWGHVIKKEQHLKSYSKLLFGLRLWRKSYFKKQKQNIAITSPFFDASGNKKHWCYYPHCSRDSVSPVCRIFLLVTCVCTEVRQNGNHNKETFLDVKWKYETNLNFKRMLWLWQNYFQGPFLLSLWNFSWNSFHCQDKNLFIYLIKFISLMDNKSQSKLW